MRCVHVSITVLALSFALTGCGEEQKAKLEEAGRTVGEKTAKTWSKLKTFTAEHKDEAVEFWHKGMSTMKAKLEKAKSGSKDLSEEAKKNLDEKWAHVETAFTKAKEVGADGWKTAHDTFVAAYEAFQAELKKHE